MGRETRDCPASKVMDHVAGTLYNVYLGVLQSYINTILIKGYALAIDCTARNLQVNIDIGTYRKINAYSCLI